MSSAAITSASARARTSPAEASLTRPSGVPARTNAPVGADSGRGRSPPHPTIVGMTTLATAPPAAVTRPGAAPADPTRPGADPPDARVRAGPGGHRGRRRRAAAAEPAGRRPAAAAPRLPSDAAPRLVGHRRDQRDRGVVRFWQLGFRTDGGTPIFDEKYYALNSWEVLTNGGYEANPGYGVVVHPPLGKQLIAIGEWLFGYNAHWAGGS